MRSARLALGAVMFVLVSMVLPRAVDADDRSCKLDPISGLLKCTLVASPKPPVTRRLGTDLPLVWHRAPLNVGELTARGIGCVRDNAGVTEIGAGYIVTLVNEATLELLYLRYVCVWPGQTPPQPPPAPPTAGELRDANVQVLSLQPAVNPGALIGGLTGLATWLWCTDPGEVATDVTLRGWTAAGQVRLVYVGWTVEGPSGMSTSSTSCGSEGAPSATWTPEIKGAYSVALTSTWAGTWDLTWNGVSMGTFTLGPISLTSPAEAYPVDEYRGELTNG